MRAEHAERTRTRELVMSGRKKNSGVKSSINPQREEMRDVRAKLLYDHREWRMVRLQESLRPEMRFAVSYFDIDKETEEKKARLKLFKTKEEARDFAEKLKREHDEVEDFPTSLLSDNFLSTRAAETLASTKRSPRVTVKDLDRLWNKLCAKRKGNPPPREEWLAARGKLFKAKTGKAESGQPDEIASHWLRLVADFERAVLRGDAEWFRRQADAIERLPEILLRHDAQARFDAVVAHELEMEFWHRRTATIPECERKDVTLEPAGKRIGKGFAQRILGRLEPRRDGVYLYVEGRQLKDEHDKEKGTHRSADSRACDAITRIAKLHGYVAE